MPRGSFQGALKRRSSGDRLETTLTTFALLPGLLSDQSVWAPLASALPGKTLPADLTQQSSIADMAASVLSQTGDDLVVFGHSMGARVAMEVARMAPGRVRALVLANTGHDPLRPGERKRRQAKIDRGYEDFAGLIAEWLPPMVAPARVTDTELMKRLTDMALSQTPESHERQIRALINRPDAAAYLPDITCPILLLAAVEDAWSPVAQHREIEGMAPNAELQVIEGAGHFLPVERPRETVEAILGFLKKHGLV